MTISTFETLKLAIDTYGADLESWPAAMQAQASQVRHDARLMQYREEVARLDAQLTEHFTALQTDTDISRIHASLVRPVKQPSFRFAAWLSRLFTVHAGPVAAGIVILAVVAVLALPAAPRGTLDEATRQWLWEEVLDETPTETAASVDDEFAFLFSDS